MPRDLIEFPEVETPAVPLGHQRLLKLAEFLETNVPPEHFDMRMWWCGTKGCALGWACTIPEFQAAGLRYDKKKCGPSYGDGEDSPFDAANAFFELEGDGWHLFRSKSKNDPGHPHDVAAAIRAYVAKAGA